MWAQFCCCCFCLCGRLQPTFTIGACAFVCILVHITLFFFQWSAQRRHCRSHIRAHNLMIILPKVINGILSVLVMNPSTFVMKFIWLTKFAFCLHIVCALSDCVHAMSHTHTRLSSNPVAFHSSVACASVGDYAVCVCVCLCGAAQSHYRRYKLERSESSWGQIRYRLAGVPNDRRCKCWQK